MRDHLREQGPASMWEIVGAVMPEHPIGYGIPEFESGGRYQGSWWRTNVKLGHEALPDVEAAERDANKVALHRVRITVRRPAWGPMVAPTIGTRPPTASLGVRSRVLVFTRNPGVAGRAVMASAYHVRESRADNCMTQVWLNLMGMGSVSPLQF